MNELILFDRIEHIKTTNKEHDLLNNSYLSLSGGKDSTVLHYLLDMALPDNKIPRLFMNTGLEYRDIRLFVEELAKTDNRIIIVNSGVNLKHEFAERGYPFKSKYHSKLIDLLQNGSTCEWVKNYIDFERESKFKCIKILRHQLSRDYYLKISDHCCYALKKNVASRWMRFNKRSIGITGERMAEGGLRANATECMKFDKKERLKKYKPLNPLTDDFMEWFINEQDIKLCKLYYPPFNFKRTGCKGCPFNIYLQNDLDTMAVLLPNERKQCEIIWAPVYAEYRRLGYRLRPLDLLDLKFIKERES